MKLKELLSEVRVLECTAALETEIRDISFDSRTTQPGVPPARISSGRFAPSTRRDSTACRPSTQIVRKKNCRP